jgi:hypothetical protein
VSEAPAKTVRSPPGSGSGTSMATGEAALPLEVVEIAGVAGAWQSMVSP